MAGQGSITGKRDTGRGKADDVEELKNCLDQLVRTERANRDQHFKTNPCYLDYEKQTEARLAELRSKLNTCETVKEMGEQFRDWKKKNWPRGSGGDLTGPPSTSQQTSVPGPSTQYQTTRQPGQQPLGQRQIATSGSSSQTGQETIGYRPSGQPSSSHRAGEDSKRPFEKREKGR